MDNEELDEKIAFFRELMGKDKKCGPHGILECEDCIVRVVRCALEAEREYQDESGDFASPISLGEKCSHTDIPKSPLDSIHSPYCFGCSRLIWPRNRPYMMDRWQILQATVLSSFIASATQIAST